MTDIGEFLEGYDAGEWNNLPEHLNQADGE
jgi:hypothetical protein